MTTLKQPATYLKAIVAGMAAAATAAGTALQDGGISSTDVWLIVGAFVGAFAATFFVPNKPSS